MKNNKKTRFFTTPLYYVNSSPHIGHTYTTVVADIIKRYHNLLGTEVFFTTGTDEHGEKIQKSAKEQNLEPKVFTDKIAKEFKDMWDELDISYDSFIRTTDEDHKKLVQDTLQKLHDSGDIYFSSYEGKYCVGCERFITDSELEDGKCKDHQKEPSVVKEENYFFKMSKYAQKLKQEILDNPDLIRPTKYRNEVLAYFDNDIDDLCISRPKTRVSWGIDLPFDDKFVSYVWFDALLNYLTVTGYPKNDYVNYWNTVEHFIAKDILKTHTLYWGTMLLAMKVPLYKHLNVHGYWNMSGLKMSKSLGNVLKPGDFKKEYGDEGLRFFFLKEMSWGNDSDFTIERFLTSYNSNLANNYGNLISRTLGMFEKYFSKDSDKTTMEITSILPREHFLYKELGEVINSYKKDFPVYNFGKTLDLMWKLFDSANKYIADSKPWDLYKNNNLDKIQEVLIPVIEIIRISTFMLIPVMPKVSSEILKTIIPEDFSFDFDNFTKIGNIKEINIKYKNKAFFSRY